MRITYGATRLVILTRRYSIKIARIKLIRPFVRLFSLEGTGVGERLKKYDARPMKAAMKYLLCGLVANRAEYRNFRAYGECDLVPTIFTLAYIVNVQIRGLPISEEDVVHYRFFDVFKQTALGLEVLKVEQMSLVGGTVCIHDYGRAELAPIFARCVSAGE